MSIGKHLTTKEVADRLNVTVARVSQFVSEGRLDVAARVGTIMFFLPDEISRFEKIPRKPGPKKKSGGFSSPRKKSA